MIVPSLWIESTRIQNEIDDDLVQPRFRTLDRWYLRELGFDVDRATFCRRFVLPSGSRHLDRATNGLERLDRLHRAVSVALHSAAQAVNDITGAKARRQNELDPLAAPGCLGPGLEHLGRSDDGGEEIVEVVAHTRSQLSDRSQPLRTHLFALGPLELGQHVVDSPRQMADLVGAFARHPLSSLLPPGDSGDRIAQPRDAAQHVSVEGDRAQGKDEHPNQREKGDEMQAAPLAMRIDVARGVHRDDEEWFPGDVRERDVAGIARLSELDRSWLLFQALARLEKLLQDGRYAQGLHAPAESRDPRKAGHLACIQPPAEDQGAPHRTGLPAGSNRS